MSYQYSVVDTSYLSEGRTPPGTSVAPRIAQLERMKVHVTRYRNNGNPTAPRDVTKYGDLALWDWYHAFAKEALYIRPDSGAPKGKRARPGRADLEHLMLAMSIREALKGSSNAVDVCTNDQDLADLTQYLGVPVTHPRPHTIPDDYRHCDPSGRWQSTAEGRCEPLPKTWTTIETPRVATMLDLGQYRAFAQGSEAEQQTLLREQGHVIVGASDVLESLRRSASSASPSQAANERQTARRLIDDPWDVDLQPRWYDRADFDLALQIISQRAMELWARGVKRKGRPVFLSPEHSLMLAWAIRTAATHEARGTKPGCEVTLLVSAEDAVELRSILDMSKTLGSLAKVPGVAANLTLKSNPGLMLGIQRSITILGGRL